MWHCKHLLDELRVIFSLCVKNVSLCVYSPVLEGIVNNGFQHQSVTDVRWATKMEHVYGPQGWMSVTQATKSKYEDKRGRRLYFVVCVAVLNLGFITNGLLANLELLGITRNILFLPRLMRRSVPLSYLPVKYKATASAS